MEACAESGVCRLLGEEGIQKLQGGHCPLPDVCLRYLHRKQLRSHPGEFLGGGVLAGRRFALG